MDLDTRNLIVDAAGIKLRPTAVARGAVICDFCVRKAPGCEVETQGERCGEFIPALAFVPPLIGLEGRFTTFRPSAIWFDRAQAVYRSHQTIALVNATDKSTIGLARLVDAHRGPFADLMRDHAWSNHLIKDQGMSRPDADVWLRRWIKNNMGSMYAKDPAAIGTVLTLERIEEIEGAARVDDHRLGNEGRPQG